MNRPLWILLIILSGTIPLGFQSPVGWAADPALKLKEIQEAQTQAEEKHRRELQELERGVSANTIDADRASEKRFKIEQEYRQHSEGLAKAQKDAIQNLDTSGPNPPAPAAKPVIGIHIPSQSVITYPVTDPSIPQTEEHPSNEGDGKNVGLGVKELEF
ncbi:hypothetical protein WDW37_12720 [Bdellovibrionota bacterium FG-1]